MNLHRGCWFERRQPTFRECINIFFPDYEGTNPAEQDKSKKKRDKLKSRVPALAVVHKWTVGERAWLDKINSREPKTYSHKHGETREWILIPWQSQHSAGKAVTVLIQSDLAWFGKYADMDFKGWLGQAKIAKHSKFDKALLGIVWQGTHGLRWEGKRTEKGDAILERFARFDYKVVSPTAGTNGQKPKAKPEGKHKKYDVFTSAVLIKTGGDTGIKTAEWLGSTGKYHGVGEPSKRWSAGGSVLSPVVNRGQFPSSPAYNRECMLKERIRAAIKKFGLKAILPSLEERGLSLKELGLW
jgi:hypothetical protein